MRRGTHRGQALVEFALVLPLLLVILFGLFDVGRAVLTYNTVNNAARQGARVAIVNQTEADVLAAAQAEAIGTPVDVTVAYHEPQPNADPSANAACSPVKLGCIVIVTVVHHYSSVTPIIGNLIGLIDLEGTTEMPVEHVSP